MNSKLRIIRVKDKYNGITLESGKELYNDIATFLIADTVIEVDFANQEYITAVFLNASIGFLYSHFKEEVIDKRVKTINVDEKYELLVERARQNSKKYWNDCDFQEAVDIAIVKLSEGNL